MPSPAPQRVLPSPTRDGNEQKFIETGFGEDGWMDSWRFSKENCGEEPGPGRVGAGAQPQTLSQAQLLLLLLLLAHYIQVSVLPHALAQLDGTRTHIFPCGNGESRSGLGLGLSQRPVTPTVPREGLIYHSSHAWRARSHLGP